MLLDYESDYFIEALGARYDAHTAGAGKDSLWGLEIWHSDVISLTHSSKKHLTFESRMQRTKPRYLSQMRKCKDGCPDLVGTAVERRVEF